MTDDKSRFVLRVPADLSDIFPDFLDNRKKEVESIPGALAIGDFQNIRIWGHNMAGCGMGYGFPAISEIGRCLETAALEKNKNAIELYMEKLAFLVSHVEVVYC